MNSLRFVILTFSLLAIGGLVHAQVPEEISYQGLLADSTGNPVGPGNWNLTFTLFDDPAAGTQVWTSGFQSVPTDNGLFSYLLGSIVPFPSDLWRDNSELWLEVNVLGSPPMLPRSKLVCAPYAKRAEIVGPNVRLGNQSTKGELNLFGAGSPTATPQVELDADPFGDGEGGALYLRDNEDFVVMRAQPSSWGTGGFLEIQRSGPASGFTVSGNHNNTESPIVAITGVDQADDIMFEPGNVNSDEKVILPDNTIGAGEIIDEPGIVSEISGGDVDLIGVAQDIDSITINVPAPGYVEVSTKFHARISGSTAGNTMVFQLSDSTDSGFSAGVSTRVGLDGYPSTGNNYFAVSLHRVFFAATSGSHTFRLVGSPGAATHQIKIFNITTTAKYFPTSYGPVKSLAASPEGFKDATPIRSPDSNSGRDMYEVDLRELEIRVKEAKIRALKAERELERAKRQALADNFRAKTGHADYDSPQFEVED